MNKKRWFVVLLVVFLLIFAGSSFYLVRYLYESNQAKQGLDSLVEIKERELGSAEQKNTGGINKGYQTLYRKNHDLIGWIQAKGTDINYPVMQTKQEPQFYLHRNFEKKYEASGLPFLDAACDINGEHQNLMVFGHHMKNGSMFASLLKYSNPGFIKKHQYITFDTLKENRQYTIVAAFYSKVYTQGEEGFRYYNYAGALSKSKFKEYVEQAIKASVSKLNVMPVYGDTLLTLSTCSYHTDEGRFVVVAKRNK